MTMTKGNFFKYYNKLNGADMYMIFFTSGDMVYRTISKHIAPRWTHEERESQKNGGFQKWKMYISVEEKAKLIRKGAEPVMTITEFESIPRKNKGHRCEQWLHETYNLGNYKPDNRRFDKGGDVEIDGVKYQVKFENASLTNVNTLRKAQKDARKAKGLSW